jgi:putative PIN family toxin of toxin-antitoxin system
MSSPTEVVIDTNVLVAALRSANGASHLLISQLGSTQWRPNVSTALLFEYEEQLSRLIGFAGITRTDVYAFLNSIDHYSEKRTTSFLLRPILPDPDDELLLDLAACARAQYIISFNVRHFAGAGKYGIRVVTPGEFLNILKG